MRKKTTKNNKNSVFQSRKREKKLILRKKQICDSVGCDWAAGRGTWERVRTNKIEPESRIGETKRETRHKREQNERTRERERHVQTKRAELTTEPNEKNNESTSQHNPSTFFYILKRLLSDPA